MLVQGRWSPFVLIPQGAQMIIYRGQSCAPWRGLSGEGIIIPQTRSGPIQRLPSIPLAISEYVKERQLLILELVKGRQLKLVFSKGRKSILTHLGFLQKWTGKNDNEICAAFSLPYGFQ